MLFPVREVDERKRGFIAAAQTCPDFIGNLRREIIGLSASELRKVAAQTEDAAEDFPAPVFHFIADEGDSPAPCGDGEKGAHRREVPARFRLDRVMTFHVTHCQQAARRGEVLSLQIIPQQRYKFFSRHGFEIWENLAVEIEIIQQIRELAVAGA